MKNKLIPPKDVYAKVTFTYAEMHTILRTFGTAVAVKAQTIDPISCHTDLFVMPLVSQYMEYIHQGFYNKEKYGKFK